MSYIRIQGAREHNLKNISVDIPTRAFVVVTGLSGSGKSTLAFATLYAEGHRRYVESLSAYARQFLHVAHKPDVDSIEGLMPAIAVDQKTVSKNPRSTVGTVTEIYDYLRLLFARIGVPISPKTGKPILKQTPEDIVRQILHKYAGQTVQVVFPLAMQRKGEFVEEFKSLRAQGFYDYIIDGQAYSFDNMPTLKKNHTHTIWVVCDNVEVMDEEQERITDATENAVSFGRKGVVGVVAEGKNPDLFSTQFACPETGFVLTDLEPRLFSFNNPSGACQQCDGIGVLKDVDVRKLIPNPNLSLSDKAVVLAKYERYAAVFQEIAQTLACDTKKPFRSLDPAQQHLFLYGGCSPGYSLVLETLGFFKHNQFLGVLPWIYKQWAQATPRRKLFWNHFFGRVTCTSCQGARVRKEALFVRVGDRTIYDLSQESIARLLQWFDALRLSSKQESIAHMLVKEIKERLYFLNTIGLGYLSLDREARTLSGGESQRIRLASQIGSGLTNVLYVLDEPSIGLHPRDTHKLIDSLERLRDLPNTVVVVEHDLEFIRRADHIIDMGPLAGAQGGYVVAQGTSQELACVKASLTGAYLRAERCIPVPKRRAITEKTLSIKGASRNNLQNISVDFPLGVFVGVTGVSGGGKSSLVVDTLYEGVRYSLDDPQYTAEHFQSIEGLEHVQQVVMVSQDPIGRTPRSNPATYCGFFSDVRKIFASTPQARRRGYGVGRFSFNVAGGRCEACEGAGSVTVEMNFLPDVEVECEECRGLRFNADTLSVTWREHSIADVLALTVDDALEFFSAHPSIKRHLQCLQRVGLGYIKLAQSGTTLSGGEAQRIKLAKELSRKTLRDRLYVLDEPTTGLHLHDVSLLTGVLQTLVDQGNTVVVIEHNLEMIKTVDWMIDLGPSGGADGGRVVAQGTPEDVASDARSSTGAFLKKVLCG